MPVIINEFEVVAEPPPQPSTPTQTDEAPAARLPSAEDIERIMKHIRERQLRVMAD